jgi:hypothetical protein
VHRPPPPPIPDAAPTSGINPMVAVGLIAGVGLLLLVFTGGLAALWYLSEHKGPGVSAAAAVDDEPADSPSVTPKSTGKKKPPTPQAKPLIVLSPENEKKVDAATAKAVQYLRSRQTPDGLDKGAVFSPNGFHVGYTSLVGLTMLEARVPASDPAVQNAARFVRQRVHNIQGLHVTYQVALSILFLSRLNDKEDTELIRSLTLRLIASQRGNGGWHYDSRPLTPEQQQEVSQMLKDFPASVGRANQGVVNGLALGMFQTTRADGSKQPQGPSDFDNSNTQFALLALWTARRYFLKGAEDGAPSSVDPALRLVSNHFRNTQQADGSWPYQAPNTTASMMRLPTMTAAGLLGLAAGYGLEKDVKGVNMAQDEVLKKAFQRLAKNVGNPGQGGAPPTIEMYFLWSVERVAVLYQLPKIEGKDWYHWGLEILLAHQKDDNGRWHLGQGHGSSDIVDTCFALLFLQRANLAQDLTDKIQEMAAMLQRKE